MNTDGGKLSVLHDIIIIAISNTKWPDRRSIKSNLVNSITLLVSIYTVIAINTNTHRLKKNIFV